MDFIQTAAQYFANMNEFRKKQLHYDVTITVDGKKFPCHRIVLTSASTYFNGMFNTNFDESKAENITIQEIHATTFEEVLNAMYTARISITPQNAYNLWKACSFLGMPFFENTCIDYIKENLPVDNLVEVCILADILKEENLLNALAKHIAENIVQLSKTNEFCHLPFEVLKLIFSQENLTKDEDVVVSIIATWTTVSNSNKNEKLIRELLDAVKLTTISLSMIVKLLNNQGKSTGCLITTTSSEECGVKLEIVPKKTSGSGTLKVYMKAFNEDRCVHDMIVMEYNHTNSKWNPIDALGCSFENLKTVIIGNRQYFLAYDRNRNFRFNSCARFWMVEDGKRIRLREPPIITEHYHLAVVGNTIYLYCSLESTSTVSVCTTSNFWCENENATDNCVFVYNCVLDVWSSTPTIENLVEGASFVAYDNMIYVVDGTSVLDNQFNIEKAVQRYDHRCSKWCTKRGCNNFCYAGACVYECNLYLSGTFWNNDFYDTTSQYDFVANKWASLDKMKIGRGNHLLIPYNNFLYAIDNKHDIPMERYCLKLCKWNDEPPFPEKVVLNGNTLCTDDVTDGIVCV